MEYVRHVCQRSNRCPSRPLQEKAYVCRRVPMCATCAARVPAIQEENNNNNNEIKKIEEKAFTVAPVHPWHP